MTENDQMPSCIIVHLEDNALHVTHCATLRPGEDNIFPLEVPLSEVRRSLGCKVGSNTVERLCDMWDVIRAHLVREGGQVFVHADRVEISLPRGGKLVKPVARSAVI